jgi:beta-aspartyl-peptidase (threonine type)
MWALVMHGGAKEIHSGQEEANRRGCLAALEAGRKVLERGGLAVDAVEATVRILEDDPTFNAGFGSELNSNREVEMCSGLMDGTSLDIGAVAAIKGVRHPVSVAKLLLRDMSTLVVSEEARRFASEHGAELCEPEALIAPDKRDPKVPSRGHDTVGCVARDLHGNLAVATSTGGLGGSRPGRVGDSPQPGGGFYADTELGAVAMTGDGEQISRAILAARIMQGLASHAPETAIRSALRFLARIGGEAGAIAINRQGQIGWAHNSPDMPVAFASGEAPAPRIYLRKSEENEGIA